MNFYLKMNSMKLEMIRYQTKLDQLQEKGYFNLTSVEQREVDDLIELVYDLKGEIDRCESYTLRDWLPPEFLYEYMDTPAAKLLNYMVIEEYSPADNDCHSCPIKYKHIYNWCVVTNGKKRYAVAWNENPSRGWSFPIKRIYTTKNHKT